MTDLFGQEMIYPSGPRGYGERDLPVDRQAGSCSCQRSDGVIVTPTAKEIWTCLSPSALNVSVRGTALYL